MKQAVSTQSEVAHALDQALSLWGHFVDVATGRVTDPGARGWWDERGWASFLHGLSDREVERAEACGLSALLTARTDAPTTLRQLAQAAAAVEARVGALPRPARVSPATGPAPLAVPLRKRDQILALLGGLAVAEQRYERVVDVGSGRGHFTRRAAAVLRVPAVGIERDAARVAEARRLALGTATFIQADALTDDLGLAPGDLLVGLHACGELADRALIAALEAGSDAALVSCCLQKIRASARPPLSVRAREAGFCPDRAVLGLSNLSPRALGVEVDLRETMRARERRASLRWLLERRVGRCDAGEEVRGLNRRWARRDLASLVARAFELRGLAPASRRELDEAELAGRTQFAAVRRLSLPRAALARSLEIAVALDRGCYAEERGYAAKVGTIVDVESTPRNLALFATRRR